MKKDASLKGENLKLFDPYVTLASWANHREEWVRYVAGQVLTKRYPVSNDDLEYAYRLLRQEKAIDKRAYEEVPALRVDVRHEDLEEPLVITKISEVSGVNALAQGQVIEPNAGLTILFGENGTGKTGYARIIEALADSRTSDAILGNITSDTDVALSAKISYLLGSDANEYVWSGEYGQAPFTRISVFDNRSVSFYVDDELGYVYTPAALSLFYYVSSAIGEIQGKVSTRLSHLSSDSSTLLERFPQGSKVFSLLQTLSVTSDLDALKVFRSDDPKINEEIEIQRRKVASLEANTIDSQIVFKQRMCRILNQVTDALRVITELDFSEYEHCLDKRTNLQKDYDDFRTTLFAAAALPTAPEETWKGFISSGAAYQAHLEELDVHDAGKCPYCRQTLSPEAAGLIKKYSEYLTSKISEEIGTIDKSLEEIGQQLDQIKLSEAIAFIEEYVDRDNKPTLYDQVNECVRVVSSLRSVVEKEEPVDADDLCKARILHSDLQKRCTEVSKSVKELQEQSSNIAEVVVTEKEKLDNLVASAELCCSWDALVSHVNDLIEISKLETLNGEFPGLHRAVTELSKDVSNQLINQNFETLFMEESKSLRAPSITIEFIGRHGQPQRRKTLSARCKPSKVLSEGEQKVLALADFLAEARLPSAVAPVVFDDPVSSLDHRRVSEVAQRIAALSDTNQVVVFTHDILFVSLLLQLFEGSERCTLYRVTDDGGVGMVHRSTGPRWDSPNKIKVKINTTIAHAESVNGDERTELVCLGYDQIRAWCEVFTEQEILQGVTERYQPNVRMTALSRIKVDVLPESIEVVTRIFGKACRAIEGHSQPLPSLNVVPSLVELKNDWAELCTCAKRLRE